MTKQRTYRKKRTFCNYLNDITLTIVAMIMLYPFLEMILTSFASYEDTAKTGFITIPRHFNFEAYEYIFSTGLIISPFFRSILITIVGTLYNLLMTALGAYVLSSKTLPGKKIMLLFILFTMFFGGGLIPFVLVVQDFGLLNKYLSLIIPFSINTFNLIIMRNYFRSLPSELFGAAHIDGAGEFRLLFAIVIPISLPVISTIGLYYVVERWNDWYWPMIFLEDNFPLALTLRSLILDSSSSMEGGGYVPPEYLDSAAKEAAVVIISILPILLLCPLLQKYFVKGIMIGAVKS